MQVRTALASGAIKGHQAIVGDATSAYLQAPLRQFNADGSPKPSQWLRLPKACWPKSLFLADGVTPRYHDPVVRLCKYGHPESEDAWDEHLASHLKKNGWLPVSGQSSCFYNIACDALLVVYVDDLLMICDHAHTSRLWGEIEQCITFSEPAAPIGKFLGAHLPCA